MRFITYSALAFALLIGGLSIAQLAAQTGDSKQAGADAKPADSRKSFSQKPEVVQAVSASDHVDADKVPADAFHVLPGFKVERLFTVPKAELGSWVSLALDNKGRLIASDQETKGLCRITPPAIGSDEETKVEHLDANISAAQGMLYAFDSLYVSVNKYGKAGTGLYRLRDTKGNDEFDEVVKLKELRGPVGEHGPHALRLSPDGKSIYLVAGNHTDPPFSPGEMKSHPEFTSQLPANWAEDLLLPRLWDPNGHARGRMAPGGWIVETDPDGKSWKMVSAGYRNAYDFDFNADGELITYDSDMEWDMGMPWYRATRIVHATDGSELGWRSGAGVWPWYYADSLPPVADVGPGSPVGVTFGYSLKFPAKFQRAFFACDWTFGTIYAITLEPEGSSYKAIRQEFVSRSPLPLTDVVVGKDGAMYFIVGGRGLPSELYRVTYVGDESTAPVDGHEPKNADQRQLRHKIEAYHGHVADDPKAAVDFLFPYLAHDDRFIRYAARVGLEFQPVELWEDRVLSASDPETVITGAVAIAHQGQASIEPKLLAALDKIDFQKLPQFARLELLRAYDLAFIRLGRPDNATAAAIAKKFDGFFPGDNELVNRELCSLLVYLQSPSIVAKTMALIKQEPPAVAKSDEELMRSELIARNRTYARPIAAMMENHPDQQKIHYAYALRNATTGWTLENRKAFFEFVRSAGESKGGHSFAGFLRDIDREAFANATDSERLALEATGAHKPFIAPSLPKPQGPEHDWTMSEVLQLAENGLKKRDFENGKKMFAAARCVVCHRFNGDGGATGPDLTQLAGRFTVKDLTESIIEPSKVISDQYRASIVITTSGKSINGRIVSENEDMLLMVTDPEDSTKVVEIRKQDIDEQKPSPISLMPVGLIKPLNEREVLDLLAYLLSRGDAKDPMFRP